MKPSSFDFTIKGKHENHSGSAVIVDMHTDVQAYAEKAFQTEKVSIRSIGMSIGPDQPGYEGVYEVYETYKDSASDDYYYFAVMVGSDEV